MAYFFLKNQLFSDVILMEEWTTAVMLPTPDTPKPLTPREPDLPPTALGMERPLAGRVVPRRTCILEGLPDPWAVGPGVGRADLTVVVEDLPEVTRAVVHLRPRWEARPGPTPAGMPAACINTRGRLCHQI